MKKIMIMLLAVTFIFTMAVGSALATEAAREELAMQIDGTESFSIDQKIEKRVMVKQQGQETAVVEFMPVEARFTEQMFPAVYPGNEPEISVDGLKLYTDAVGNEVDYFVSVSRQNDSVFTSDENGVYVRTVFAFQNTDKIVEKMHFNVNTEAVIWEGLTKADKIETTIDGQPYRLFVCTYQQPLLEGETTPYSMKQFCFGKDITNFGFDEYRIMVQSWAVSDSSVFNEITEHVHPWATSAVESNA